MNNQTISEAVRERDAVRQKVKDWCRDDLIAECLSLYDQCDCLNGIIRKTSEEMGELRKSLDAAARVEPTDKDTAKPETPTPQGQTSEKTGHGLSKWPMRETEQDLIAGVAAVGVRQHPADTISPDTVRIDWLEKNGGWLGDENLKAKWTVSIPTSDKNSFSPTSLRQAIDASLGAATDKGKEEIKLWPRCSKHELHNVLCLDCKTLYVKWKAACSHPGVKEVEAVAPATTLGAREEQGILDWIEQKDVYIIHSRPDRDYLLYRAMDSVTYAKATTLIGVLRAGYAKQQTIKSSAAAGSGRERKTC